MDHLIIILIGFVLAISLARIIIPNIIIISRRKGLFDLPDGRKVHRRPISRLGGVCFFPTILFAVTFLVALCKKAGWFFWMDGTTQFPELLLLCSGLTLLFIVGIADDLVGVRWRQKFLVQIFAAAMFPLAGLYVNDFYGMFGIYSIPVYIGVPLSILLVVFITNAINLIDGIDGLASGLSIVALFVYGNLFIYNGLWLYSLLAFTTIGVLLPFFYYNVFGQAERGKKIFMGDTGSLTLGFILSFLTIKYTMNQYVMMNFNRRRNRRALSRISRLCRILSVSRVHIVRCDEWTHTLRQKEWYHGEKWIFVSFVQMKISVWKGLFLLTEQIAADHMTG